jgi:putative phosphoribosyl transferase
MWQNRIEAGQKLAVKLKKELLEEEKKTAKLLVLAIPRGGVVIGRQLADFLNCPLDLIITKKIGAPHNPELAIGAVGGWGEPVVNQALAEKVGADEKYLKLQIANLRLEIKRREEFFRKNKSPLNLKNKIVIITDDGVATGSTIKAAVEIVRQSNPQKIIVAVPVIAKDTLPQIESIADEVVYLEAPELFFAVGQFYQDFEQITDEEVVRILNSK